MGICKKCRVRTDLYCINHDKYTCEECVIKEHALCRVALFKNFLESTLDIQSPEFQTCSLCNEVVNGSLPFIRFHNFQLFHLSCIDSYGAKVKREGKALLIPGTDLPLYPEHEPMYTIIHDIKEKLKSFTWLEQNIENVEKPLKEIINDTKNVPEVDKPPTNFIKSGTTEEPKITSRNKKQNVPSSNEKNINILEDSSVDISLEAEDNKYKKRRILRIIEYFGIINPLTGNLNLRRIIIYVTILILFFFMIQLSMTLKEDSTVVNT